MSRKRFHATLPRDEQKKRSQERLINLLISAIVQAYPYHSPNVKDQTRIARAREALFGERIPRGQKSIKDDIKLFPLYAEALRHEVEPFRKAAHKRRSRKLHEQIENQVDLNEKSDAAIAREFSSQIDPRVRVPKSRDRWLRKLISEFSLTSADMADLQGLFEGNSPKAERLRHIFADLEAIGVLSKSPIRTEIDDLNPETD